MARLFHYHWWTEKVEELEKFYESLGFETVLRLGKYQGEMKSFNPPLAWKDFRDKNIRFRIIEMRKGKTNLTFGHGKRNQFDHIGFLVNDIEHGAIVQRAKKLNWKVTVGERRTFIGTPWRLRLELQKRVDVVADEEDMLMKSMQISLPFNENPTVLTKLLDLKMIQSELGKVVLTNGDWDLFFVDRPYLNLEYLQFSTIGQQESQCTDPLHTTLIIKRN